ncbi:MAG: C69 family dipeptidase [Muribaculaceae bacterium]|nr:C69 family dipeptidase [Muribaculaceae bacterium]MDE6754962.1 C69 family dipeptidase [Muribaculaceae bacterium]
MKHLFLSIFLAGAASLFAQDAPDACTSIMVGKKASADGSVMTSHTCDSWYRTWMQMADAKDYPRDTVVSIFKGRMHTEYPSSRDGMTEAGTIPQAKHTYRFLDTAYPCLNEKQLAMGETTFSGRDTLRNEKGMFLIEELQRIALERCTTAREAISLMGKLIKEYGYADGGECLTIADPKEVWIFEVLGEGPDKIGGVWAAQRIPDDHIAVSANVSRIGKIDFKDKDNFMYSDNVKDVARKLGLWDGKSEFNFWKAYSGGNYQKEEKNYSVRELFIMNELAPGAGFTSEMSELPVSVKPEKPVSVEDVSRLLASYYEGTDKNLSGRLKVKNSKKNIEKGEPDSVVSVFANPWMRPDEIAVYEAMGDSVMHNIRTVSVSWCAYSHIIQCRDWLPDAVGGVAWVALDNPGQSPRFPIFAGNTDVPELLKVCGQHRERDDAALWRFRKPNRLATVRWGQSRKFTEPARDHFLKKGKMEMPMVEQLYLDYEKAGNEEEGKAMLTEYSKDFFGAAVNRWDELDRRLWYQHWRGF